MQQHKLVSDPVDPVNGHLFEITEEFSFPQGFSFTLFRKYGSDFTFSTSMGKNNISPLDIFIIDGGYGRFGRKEVIYHDANGLSIHFNRPVPIPGGWETNIKHKNLRLYAGKNRSLILHDGRLKYYFKKYPDKIWRLERMALGKQELLFERNANGFLLKLNHPSGLSLEFYGNNQGLRLGYDLVNPKGERIELVRYSYNEDNHLIKAFNAYGGDRFYRYDDKGRRVSWSDGAKTSGHHHFDSQDRVTKVETSGPYNGDCFIYKPEEGVTDYVINGEFDKKEEYIFNKKNMLTSIRNALGIEQHFEYNEDSYEISQTNGEGESVATNYDNHGRVRSTIDAEGRETYYIHNSEGDLLQVILPDSSGWKFNYDENGNLLQTTNPLGVITEFKNNECGQPVAIMRHDGLMEQRQYDDYGRLIVVSDFKGTKTHIDYDGFGRIISVTDGKGATTKLKYEHQKGADFWSPSAIKRPDGVVISKTYDQKQQIVKTVDGEGRETTYTYGPFQLLESIEDAKGGKLHFQYDGQERLLNVSNQLGQKWLFERDAAGRVIKEIDFAGLIQNYSYDKADRIIATQYADGAKLNFAYDKSGLLLKEQAFANDGSLQDETTYHYDQTGLLSRAENNSAVVAFKHDALGRVISETLNGREVTNTYDCCGNRTAREIGGKLVEATYDPLGALQSLTINKHQPLQMTLDPLGRELKRESAAGFVLNQSYDVLGQLKSQIGGFAIASLGRGLEGAMAAQQQGIDPSKATSQVERHFNWNKSFEPLTIDDKRWGNTSYNYDVNGQIVENSSSDGTVERFRYDGALNISSFSGSNTADTAKFEKWLSRQGGAISEAKGPNDERVHLTYDSRNRVIERRVEKNGFRIKIWKYQWDAKDRLIGCTTPKGERWTYHYDPFGRRIFKINASIAQKALLAQSPNVTELEKSRGAYHEDNHQRGSGDMSSETIVGTAYLWDANTIAEEAPLKANGEADWDKATKWHYEPETFRPIAKETANGELFYIVNDHLGTPREMFSENGKLVWAAQYRTWGAVHKIWQADNDNDIRGPYPPPICGNLAFKYDSVEAQAAQTCPIRFQGQWEDAETGLYYNRYRYYDPLAAQYLSPDPIGLAGGLRTNGYVHNPSVWVDPWGLICCLKGSSNFRDHYNRHKGLLAKVLDKKYPYWAKKDGDNFGQFFLDDLATAINDGKLLKQDGLYTLMKGGQPLELYQGNGLLAFIAPDGTWVTMLQEGKGKAITLFKVE